MSEQNEKFINSVVEVLEQSAETVTLDTPFSDFSNWDSLNKLRLLMKVEGDYGVRLDFTKYADVKTLGDLLDLVQSAQTP